MNKLAPVSPPAVRTLVLGNFFGGAGGTPQVCEELSRRLQAKGWHVLTSSSYRNRPLRLLDMTTSVWRCRNQYDVAHLDVFSGKAFLWAQAAAEVLQLCRKPYVVSLRGGALPDFAARSPRSVERLLSRAAAVTAPSAFLARRFRATRPDIQELSNPLDLSRYRFRLRRPIAPRIVWLRSFHEVYDPSAAIDVLRIVLAERPDAKLVMVGPDRQDGSLARAQERCRRFGLNAHVEFAGAIAKTDVPGVLDQADLFLNTSLIDNTPVSVMEAMACGLPIVTSNVGGIPDLLLDDCDALLFAPGDVAGMAQGILRLAKEPGLAERLVRHAREKARSFDWSIALPAWQRLLAGAAGKA